MDAGFLTRIFFAKRMVEMRLTKWKEEKQKYIVDPPEVCCEEEEIGGEAITKLAAFEDFFEELILRQEATRKEMERLRAAGKVKTTTFRQLVAIKLTNEQILDLLRAFDIV